MQKGRTTSAGSHLRLLIVPCLLALLALAALRIGLGSIDASAVHAAADVPTGSIARTSEPIVLTGLFLGSPGEELFAYRYNNATWEQIPLQIDEKTADGIYTADEDGLLDANDELAFMAGDLGDMATAAPTETLPISQIWYSIHVTDPLSPTAQGWAYIVRSQVLTRTNSTDYVDYVEATQRIQATDYSMGWAMDHNGFDYMSLFGGEDILDRTKVRVKFQIFGQPRTITEDTFPVQDPILIKDGPVRTIVSRGPVLNFAYGSLMVMTTPIDLTLLPVSSIIQEVRISTDLTSNVGGLYYDENTPSGVPIDGSPDGVATTPFEKGWRQISLNDGTAIHVTDLSSVGGTKRHYYKDDSTVDGNDTGDGQSYADAGFVIATPIEQQFAVTSMQYVLSAAQENQGDEYYARSVTPLVVSVQQEGGSRLYLPITLR